MRRGSLAVAALLLLGSFIAGCGNDSVTPKNDLFNVIALQPVHFPTLKSGLVYEGWVVNLDADSNWVGSESFGQFFWDERDYRFLSPTDTLVERDSVFTIKKSVYDYHLIAITLEPIDVNAKPSPTIIAQSSIVRDRNTIMQFPAKVSDATGFFTVATFSDGNFRKTGQPISSEYNGLWFMDFRLIIVDTTENFTTGLTLPVLPDTGYLYEGWAELSNGDTVSTGKFYFATYNDYDNEHCADGAVPNFPGEDFIKNVSKPVSFVNGGSAFVTIEPNPDNDLARPANLVVLKGNLPTTNENVRVSSYPMANIAALNFPKINAYFTVGK